MIPFRISLDARHWFRDLRNQEAFRIDFDAFYFCFITGITVKRKEMLSSEMTAELVDYFPDNYKARSKLLVSLFLHVELDMLGVSMQDRQDVHSAISKLVAPEARNFLSSDGVREFNKFSHGGYQQLIEWFDDRPRSLETFLQGFKRKLEAVR